MCSVAVRGGLGQDVRANANSAAHGDSSVALYHWLLDAVFTTKGADGVQLSRGRKTAAYERKFTFDPSHVTFVPLAASYQGCIDKDSQVQLKGLVKKIRDGAGVDPTRDVDEWAWLQEDFNWKTRSPKGDYKRVLELLAIQLVRGWSLSYRFLIGNLPRRHVHMGPRVDDDEEASGHAAGARSPG